jgi:hypothetical protein
VVVAYEGLWGLALNLVIAVGLTAILRAMHAGDSADETTRDDDEERDGEPPLPATCEEEARFAREGEPTRPTRTRG